MNTVQVVYWRDIPAQVKVKAGRERATRPLSDRFQIMIDRAAMRAGLFNTDDYLEAWRTVDLPAREGEPQAVADAVAGELEADYPDDRLEELAIQGGQA
jgi:cvfA/B/C family virulence factor